MGRLVRWAKLWDEALKSIVRGVQSSTKSFHFITLDMTRDFIFCFRISYRSSYRSSSSCQNRHPSCKTSNPKRNLNRRLLVAALHLNKTPHPRLPSLLRQIHPSSSITYPVRLPQLLHLTWPVTTNLKVIHVLGHPLQKAPGINQAKALMRSNWHHQLPKDRRSLNNCYNITRSLLRKADKTH